jgi:hypothetical protein
MKSYYEAANRIYLNYFIIFNAVKPDKSYSPIVNVEEIYGTNTHHLFDDELVDILPAVEFCLNLPRVSIDTKSNSIDQVLAGKYVPHNITIIPNYEVDKFVNIKIPDFQKPTMILFQDECKEEAKKLEIAFGCKLSSLSISEIKDTCLIDIWNEIAELINDFEGELCLPELDSYKLGDIDINLLPQLFLENQFGSVEPFLQKFNHENVEFSELINEATLQKAKLLAYNDIERGVSNQEPKALIREYFYKSRIPLTLAYPGMPPKYKKTSGLNQIPLVEHKVIRLMSAHNAISKTGCFYECKPVKDELYNLLYNLEDHCCEDNQKSHYIWKTLRKMGQLLSEQLGDDGIEAIKRSSAITAFTNFPIGLAILPETTAPLCCFRPISYNPLTPLTRAMQLELNKTPIIYLGESCKVVIAECLDSDDSIRPYSDHIWEIAKDISKSNKKFDVVKKDITSISDMKKFLKTHSDADILVISAHGSYIKESNMSGLVIGKEIWFAHENESIMPPLVLLSACHVSPRGSGSVNITDLLLRTGAIAILGTFIPVDVRKNGLLMIRLFVYIIESMSGRSKFNTIDEIWQFVVSSNAVSEVVSSNPKITKWANTINGNGESPIREFMLDKSKGKLRFTHIYDDTISILKELAARDGILDQFENALSSQGYFPESIFYQFVGRPENIIIHEPILDNVIQKSRYS